MVGLTLAVGAPSEPMVFECSFGNGVLGGFRAWRRGCAWRYPPSVEEAGTTTQRIRPRRCRKIKRLMP
jgi:hypothetical protein